jgi:hypothetical protein
VFPINKYMLNEIRLSAQQKFGVCVTATNLAWVSAISTFRIE